MAITPKTNGFNGLAGANPVGRTPEPPQAPARRGLDEKTREAIAGYWDHARKPAEHTFSFDKGHRPSDAETYQEAASFWKPLGHMRSDSIFGLTPTATPPASSTSPSDTVRSGPHADKRVRGCDGLTYTDILSSVKSTAKLSSSFLGAADGREAVLEKVRGLVASGQAAGDSGNTLQAIHQGALAQALPALESMAAKSPADLAQAVYRNLQDLKQMPPVAYQLLSGRLEIPENHVKPLENLMAVEMFVACASRILLAQVQDVPPQLWLL